jgi:glycosyltransferase involved in cell wall biosynthesis
MRADRPSLSIVVPAYNEAARIAHSLNRIGDYVRENAAADFELIVVDDGSSDDTVGVAARSLPAIANLHSRIIRYAPNRGKGYAVRQGLLAARAPIALFTDADLSTPIAELPKLVAEIVEGKADLTFGSRALDRSLIGTHQPRYREWGGRAFNLVLRLATALPYWDTQCGFKAFRMSVCRPLIDAGTIDGFGFDVELLYEAHRAGLRMQEIPVRWDHRDGSKVHFLRDGSRMLRDAITVRSRGAGGRYDRAIFACLAARREDVEAVHAVPGRAIA